MRSNIVYSDNTLHLNLLKSYYFQIADGFKKEEYRTISDYWFNRLFEFDKRYGLDIILESDNPSEYLFSLIQKGKIKIKRDTITFSNGYSKDRPQMEVEIKSIGIGEGKSKWGAIPGVKYFCLELGNIIRNNH